MRKPPSYRLHKPTGQAVVTLHGKDYYLGQYESPESWQAYHRLLLQHITQSPQVDAHTIATQVIDSVALTVNELILQFWHYARGYYVKDGTPTSEMDCLRHALGFLRRCHGTTLAHQFGPKALKAVREAMINHPILRRRRDPQTGDVNRVLVARGLARKVINRHVGRIKRMFAWAVEEEILPVNVFEALRCVRGLRKGRTSAREKQRIKPVPEAHYQAVLRHLPELVAVMVQIHRLSGCRSQDILSMRGIDLDTTGDVWEYRPASYKTMHLNEDDDPDLERVIYLGPKAQELLKPWLLDDPEAYLFSPSRSEAIRRAARRTLRKTPLYPSHQERYRCKKSVNSPLREHYDDNSYRRAVQRACEQAGIPAWSPKRLRHSRLTEIRRAHGLEASKACAGHREIAVTQHYAEQDSQLARKVMLENG
jgi:integrase